MAEVASSEGSAPLDIPPELLEYFLNDPSYIVCPQCNNVWENAGAGNENDCRHVRTENGKLLNTSAREHYTKYRFRCPRCESIFCSSCKIIPYHLGFTCTEFDEAIKSLKCRWCKEKIVGETIATSGPPKDPQRMFCGKCKDKESACLSKTHADCGHPSIWHHSMPERMPECIHPTCVEKKSGNESSQKTTLEDFCAICWVEELSYSPCLKLNCGHIFHAECVKNKLKHRWTPGGAVSLSFLECPLCKAPIDWPATCQPYVNDLRGLQELRADLKLRSLQQLKIDNLEENLSTDEEQRFDYAMHKFNFYECFKCKSFYYGGRKECDRQAAAAAPVDGEQPVPDAVEGADQPPAADQHGDLTLKPEELICGGCRASCPVHGSEQMAYKCRFCCSVASFYCFGHTHFCATCHAKPWSIVSQNNYQFIVGQLPVCPGPHACPLGVPHPPNGEEYVLGCGACGEFVIDQSRVVKSEPEKLEGAVVAENPLPR